MNRPPLKPHVRYVSTTMSLNRSIKDRWINGFKLAFFASVLFGLVGLPFDLAASFIEWILAGAGWQLHVAVWIVFLALAIFAYPILFDWLASVFRIQFVRKSIRLPGKPAIAAPPASPPEASDGTPSV